VIHGCNVENASYGLSVCASGTPSGGAVARACASHRHRRDGARRARGPAVAILPAGAPRVRSQRLGLLARRARPHAAPFRPVVQRLRPVERGFYQRPYTLVGGGPELAGPSCCQGAGRGRRGGRASPRSEAYLGVDDPPATLPWAAHGAGRKDVGRRRPPLRLLTYGMHHCANVVTRRAGEPEAVLLRPPRCGARLEAGRGTARAGAPGRPPRRAGPAVSGAGDRPGARRRRPHRCRGGLLAGRRVDHPPSLMESAARLGSPTRARRPAWPLNLRVVLGARWPAAPSAGSP